MKHRALLRRILAVILAVTMMAGYAVPAGANSSNPYQHLSFKKVDNSVVTAQPPLSAVNELDQAPAYADSEIVRVSIVLDKASTLETGFSTMDIANNADAMAYRASLKKEQDAMVTAIERQALNGGKLDVVWNITLAGNIISANVAYGQIDEIEAVQGVQQVLIENRYEPMVVDSNGGVDPNMATSGEQIGTSAAYAAGYTGAGSRIAVIDTGTDSDHQSFDAGAFEYSLAQLDGEYDLMDMEDIRDVLDELNISVTPEQAYHNAKLPFAYNYVDRDYDITHDNDAQGGHGSHVAGIAAANAYIPDGNGGYTNALSSVYVQGVAPDAQLITLKVFGKNGGAYESDYIVAIEDAVILGADSVNLSLGSGNPGRSENPYDAYQRIMDNLVNSDTVVTVSAGNSGHWADYATHMKPGYLYSEDVGTHTGGAPGSFTNSLTIASVENDGNTGYFIQVEDVISVYEEDTKYYQKALRTLQGEREYVFFENVGVDASGSNLMEEYADVVDGKVVLVSRGESNFSTKHDAVNKLGGTACIIYNNQPGGTFGMDLSASWTDIPCVSITAADGANIAAVSEPVCDEAGNVLYYTGTMTIGNSYAAAPNYSEYYTMSSFSSWGVPVSLELKPDIVAPGGNIYSVDGTDWKGEAYRLMSGTSMAAPQAAGMSALVAQYLRETGLAEAEGLTVRALTQSLLMSTASPMLDSTNQKYYPVIQQGAGLADVGEAISAQSYVLMGEGACKAWADGKVKAELGDDPDRNGVYSFSFSLNNLTDTDKVYTLSSDIFTQDILLASDGEAYMDRLIRPLSSTVEFLVDGKSAEASDDLIGLDFNGDTLVNEADGQMLLDYATGVVTELTSNAELADLDADGDVDSYDAYLFFSMLDDAVVVPANGTADVTVTVTLSDADKAFLDENFVNGAYVQGYIFAEGLSTEEGVQGTEHSIPMMAFYGNWSDPSMYDPGNYMEYITNTREHDSYMNVPEVNAFYINYADRPGEDYYFGGNPIVPDDTYMPERNAFNNEKGDLINDMRFGAIRNAGQSRYTAVNTTTGELMEESILGAIDGAYFNVIQGSWQNNNWMLEDLFFNAPGANENDVVELTLTLVPDYYVADDGSVEWDKLGAGTDLSISMVIDNTDPVLENVKLDLENNTLTVVASDNQYISGICLYNKSGTKLYTYTGAKQEIQPGESAEYVLDLNGVNGKRFTVQVTDYAMNTSTYFIEQQIGEEVPLPAMLGFATTAGDEEYWIGFDRNVALDNDYYAEYQLPHYAPALDTFYGATMIDHMVLASTDEGKLYIMPADDMGDMTLVGYLGCTVTDMAYDKANGVVYGVTDKSQLVTIDKMSAKVTVLGKIGISTNTLAYQDGTFYCALLGTNELYSFTLDTLAEPELLVALTYFDSTWHEDVNFVWDDVQGMEIDPNTGKLCWTSYSFESILYDFGWGEPFYSDRIYSYFIEVDPKTAKYEVYNDIMWRVCAMAIPEKTIVEGDWSKPTDTAEGVRLTEDEITVYERYSVDLDATVYPWTATDRSVTWSTENESIATVDENGLVTGHAEGTTTVTATSTLNPSLSASCTVHVEKLQVTLDGVLQKAGGETVLYNWNLADDATWEEGITLMPTLTAATYDTVNDKLYIMDGASFSWRGHRIDPATGEIEASSAAYTSSVTWDLAYSQLFSTESSVKVAAVMEDYVLVPQDLLSLSGQYISLFDYLYKFGGSVAVAIASGGPQEYYDPATDYTYDTELFYVLDDAGNVWYLWIYKSGAQYKAFISCQPSTLPELAFEGYSVVKGCSMVLGDDGALYLSYFNGITNELYRLAYNAEEECWESTTLGDFGRNVWPAPITAATSNLPVSNAVAMPAAFAHVSAMEMDEQSQTEAANAAVGSLNASTSHANAEPMSNVSENNCKVITVEITAKDASGSDIAVTNGLTTVTYDADLLNLKDVTIHGDYTAKVEEDGKLSFGYVSLTEIPAGDTVATLTFEFLEAVESTVTVEHKQVNNATGGTETLTVEFEHTNTEIRDAIEATCTTAGYTGDTWCLDCGQLIAKGEIIQATGHNWSEWTVTEEPTCTVTGVETRTCSNEGCGLTESRLIREKGHSYTEEVVEPTCTDMGYTIYTCECGHNYVTNIVHALGHDYEAAVTEPTHDKMGYTTYTCACGHSYVGDYTDALGHTYTATVTKEPTCTEEGERTYTCECGKSYTESIRMIPHSYEAAVTAPTHEKMGYTTYTCACGHSYIADYTDALGHEFVQTVTKEPSCTEEGVMTFSCECGESYTMAIPMTAHSYKAAVKEPTHDQMGYTTYTCENCDHSYISNYTDALGHNYVSSVTREATCTQEGVLTYTCDCGKTYTETIPMVEHTYESVVTEPTCASMGYTTHICAVCGDSYKDNYVDALAHDCEVEVVEATCTEYGYTANVCKNCDYSYISEITQPMGHKGEVMNAKEATCTEDGYTGDLVCTVCEEILIPGEVIPASLDLCPSKIFTDVDQSQWYHEGIDFVVEKGLMNGMGDGLFQPNGQLTRGQIVTILYRMAGEPEVTGTAPFTDVVEGKYYEDAVIWGHQNNIVKGMSETVFAPEMSVSREQLVTFLSRYVAWTGEDITAEDDLIAYPDASSVSAYAVEAMKWAVENGIINGIDGKLAPKEFATRAQIATVIMRLLIATEN